MSNIDDTNKKNSTLLVVDDMPTNLKLLLSYLHALDFSVQVARDGIEALEQAVYAPPDLILLDIMMPGIDGFETCRRLKADKRTRDIPVIFMSALSSTTDKVRGLQLGAVDYITKPFQQAEVAARIHTHLTLMQQERELKRQRREILEKNAELERQNAELDAFAHTVAHDLKTPVNLIVNSHEFLTATLAPRLNPDESAFLQYPVQASRKMINIINSLLLLASVRAEEAVMEPLDMAAILLEVQKSLTYMIEEYQAQITISQDWPLAMGYAPWIEEVWRNYLSNGIKYGGSPPHLELGATPEEGGQVRFWVRDNGPGLSSEEQERLFVPFTRISQVRVEGHGLGLSIVQRIVEKCNGKSGVDSQIGQGCLFYFTLPAMLNEPAT
ncbi:MAG: response regulator [Gammaproteobacteria bacterium]|nr:response regulator [Gammaproteobacteria bacterium]